MSPAKRPDPTGSRVMDVVAGPQGSGKSTFFPVSGRPRDAFNVDERRKQLNGGIAQRIPPSVRRQATTEYEAFIETHIHEGRGFAIEATLARDITFEQAKRARQGGFRIQLTYVAAGVDECCERVANRVELGGHGVPVAVIRATHEASTRNLVRAIREFDLVVVYDNSSRARLDQTLHEAKPRLVLEARSGVVTHRAADPPDWLVTALSGTPYEGEADQGRGPR